MSGRIVVPTTLAASFALVVTIGMSSLAHAEVEIGGIAGVHVFSSTNELGVPDEPDAPSQSNSALFGLRLGYYFNDYIGIEGEGGLIPTQARAPMLFNVLDLSYRGQVVYQFRASDPHHQLLPHLFAGIGAMTVVHSGMPSVIGANCGEGCKHDTDPEPYVGIGAKYRVDNGWGLRGDLYVLFPPSSASNGVTTDFEALLSIYKEFGRKRPAAELPKPALDTDGDGIPDDQDACPNEPEDKDGFQDEDGCPDPDNDADGIPDGDDKCPNDPEDHDGFQDADGCAEPDNDGDGIPDVDDMCPNEAEDKDGFQDADGCPDPDNDGDGIPDSQDKCPNEPETKNGYQDEDGCPDEIPAKLKQFTGAVQGINFKLGSADLLPNSSKTLDKVVDVLKQYPDAKLEIQGHTDDQPMRKGGKFASNKELSQGRADSVQAYLVAHGIAAVRLNAIGFGDDRPMSDPKGLKGGKLTAARAKNRRVEFRLVNASELPAP